MNDAEIQGKRERRKLPSEQVEKERWHKFCVKRSSGLSTKRQVNCWQILSLFMLFLVGSVASHMVLLSTVVVWFVYEEKADPTKTPGEWSLIVYKKMLVIELITMAFSILFSIIFGYMYEIWSRKKVLTIAFILLAIGMVLPESGLVDENGDLYIFSRIMTCVLAQAIMQNPLLNDYVKRHNMGWANAMQVLGKEVGEITAFVLIYKGIHYDKENQQMIFYVMTGLVLVVGLLTTIFLVKETKVERNYVKT